MEYENNIETLYLFEGGIVDSSNPEIPIREDYQIGKQNPGQTEYSQLEKAVKADN